LRAAGKKRNDTSLLYTGQAMQAGLLGFSAAAIFVSGEYLKPFWIIVALTATVPMLLKQQSRKHRSPQNTLLMPPTEIATISA
jgi:hypothetical protein